MNPDSGRANVIHLLWDRHPLNLAIKVERSDQLVQEVGHLKARMTPAVRNGLWDMVDTKVLGSISGRARGGIPVCSDTDKKRASVLLSIEPSMYLESRNPPYSVFVTEPVISSCQNPNLKIRFGSLQHSATADRHS